MLRRTFVFGNKNRRYSIPEVPRASEVLVNDYNAAILLFWKANIDLQYVPADATDIVNYITSYTTKGEKAKKQGKDNMDRYAMEGISKSKALFQIGLDICNKREIGLLELVDDLMCHENYAFHFCYF
ncbi:unnamed protein product [Caenorhabditis nigoni]